MADVFSREFSSSYGRCWTFFIMKTCQTDQIANGLWRKFHLKGRFKKVQKKCFVIVWRKCRIFSKSGSFLFKRSYLRRHRVSVLKRRHAKTKFDRILRSIACTHLIGILMLILSLFCARTSKTQNCRLLYKKKFISMASLSDTTLLSQLLVAHIFGYFVTFWCNLPAVSPYSGPVLFCIHNVKDRKFEQEACNIFWTKLTPCWVPSWCLSWKIKFYFWRFTIKKKANFWDWFFCLFCPTSSQGSCRIPR